MTQKPNNMQATVAISAIFAFRMLGLFMLIPVFTVYARELNASTASLIGIALGVYGLTQGVLQIPFGFLSDKYGRKPVITLGLALFGLGSLLAVFSTNIYTMIFARSLQGAGAIGSTLIALLSDLTEDTARTKCMAFLGMTIGMSFSLAMLIGPPIAHHFHLSGIFVFTFCLSILALFILYTVVPTPSAQVFKPDVMLSPKLISTIIKDKALMRLNAGIFFQHAIFTALFYALPLILKGKVLTLWHFYLPIIIFGFLIALPLIIIGEKKHQLKSIFLLAIALILISQVSLIFVHDHLGTLATILLLFFTAFNVLEASLPSLVSKTAQIDRKGTAMGIYSSCQFLGIFIGGALSGYLYTHLGLKGIFYFTSCSALLWFALAKSMPSPTYKTPVSETEIEAYNS